MNFLTTLLAKIIEPILDRKLKEWEQKIINNQKQNKRFKEYDSIAMKNIKAMESATTPEEVKAHARRIYQERARLNI